MYIPYKDFKEKIRLVKEYKKKGYYVEDWGQGIYCFKVDGYRRKKRRKDNAKQRL